jgi:hypothetical protein
VSGFTKPELARTDFKSEKLAKTRSSKLWLSTASTHSVRPRRHLEVYIIIIIIIIII